MLRRSLFSSSDWRRAIIAAGVCALIYSGCSDGDDPVKPPVTGGTVSELLINGHSAFRDGKYDEAAAQYEAAYQKDKNSAEAITYSAMAKIAMISVDPKIANFLKNRAGFTNYPNRMNALFTTEWLTEYPIYNLVWEYYDEKIGEWAYYYDQSDIDYYNRYYDYEGLERPGYYHCESEWGFDENGEWVKYTCVLSSTERRMEREILSGYYDAAGRWVQWRNEWYVGYYPGVDQAGYYLFNRGTGEWVLVSTEPRYRNAPLPGLETAPNWVRGGSETLYGGSLANGTMTAETWAVTLLANLLDKNTNGLNDILDDLLSVVFGSGSAFEAIAARVGELKGKEPVKLDRVFLRAAYMDHLIDEFDVIGWAELNALVSALTGIRAAIEWVSSYDWNTNLNFLKYAWADESAFYERLRSNLNAADLPFNNNFLNMRPGNRMETSKASFIEAMEGLKASYDAILDNPRYPTAVKDARDAVNAGVGQFISAVKNGGVFYIPEYDPTVYGWPTSGNGIDMGRFFMPGYFSLKNIFEVDGEGRPVFYSLDGMRLTPDNYLEEINWIGYAGFRLKTSHISDILVSSEPLYYGEDPIIPFPDKYAQLLFEKYYGLPLSAPQHAPGERLAKIRTRDERPRK